MKPRLSFRMILISLIGFVLLWAVLSDAWGYSEHLVFPNSSYVYGYLSRLLWVLPALLLMLRYRNELHVPMRVLFSAPKWNPSLGIVLFASVLVVAVSMVIAHGSFWFNREANLPLTVLKFVLVGFVEETIFRGWGYNALRTATTERKAVLVSSLCFAAVHIPAYLIKWYRFGSLDLFGMLVQCGSTLVFGTVFCWLLKKSKTLWNPILAHAIYDLLYVLFVG